MSTVLKKVFVKVAIYSQLVASVSCFAVPKDLAVVLDRFTGLEAEAKDSGAMELQIVEASMSEAVQTLWQEDQELIGSLSQPPKSYRFDRLQDEQNLKLHLGRILFSLEGKEPQFCQALLIKDALDPKAEQDVQETAQRKRLASCKKKIMSILDGVLQLNHTVSFSEYKTEDGHGVVKLLLPSLFEDTNVLRLSFQL